MSASSSVTPRAPSSRHISSEHLAAAPRHLVGRVDVREARQSAAGREVPVGRVHHELHRRRHRLVRVALGRARRRGARARLGRQPPLHEPIHQREHRAEVVARRPDPVRAHQRRIQARDVGLDDAPRHAGREQVQRRAAVRRAVAGLVRGQRHARAQVRAHEQRVDHAGGRTGVREPLVAPRRHSRERERRAAEHPRQRRDLLDVRRGVAPHARRVAAVDRGRPGRRECARGPGPARPRCRATALSPWPGQFARREVVAQHRVERVDHLAARRDEPHAAAGSPGARVPRRARALPRARAAPTRPSASGTPRICARRSRNGRSKPCRLWFSMTSGSSARILATSRRIRSRSAASPSPRSRAPRWLPRLAAPRP